MRFAHAAAVAAVVWALPALAQGTKLNEPECTDANVKSIGEMVDKLQDADKKRRASDELRLAKEAMGKKNVDDCKDHLLKANLQTK